MLTGHHLVVVRSIRQILGRELSEWPPPQVGCFVNCFANLAVIRPIAIVAVLLVFVGTFLVFDDDGRNTPRPDLKQFLTAFDLDWPIAGDRELLRRGQRRPTGLFWIALRAMIWLAGAVQ